MSPEYSFPPTDQQARRVQEAKVVPRPERERAEARTPTPAPVGWEERSPALPYVGPSSSDREVFQAAQAHAVQEAEKRERVQRGVVGWLRSQETRQVRPLKELAGKRTPLTVAAFLQEQSARPELGKYLLTLSPDEKRSIHAALEALSPQHDREHLAVEVMAPHQDGSNLCKLFRGLVNSPTELQEFVAKISQRLEETPYAGAAVTEASELLAKSDHEFTEWTLLQLPKTPDELSNFVAKNQGVPDTDPSVKPVGQPGEIFLLHRNEAGNLDAMMSVRRVEQEPDLEISPYSPQVDLGLATDQALEQAVHAAVSKEACLGRRLLAVIHRFTQRAETALTKTTAREVLTDLEQIWPELFAPYIARMKAEVDQYEQDADKRHQHDNSSRARRLAHAVLGRSIPRPDELNQKHAQLVETMQADIERFLLVLEAEALNSLKEEQKEQQIQGRVAKQIIEMAGLPSIQVHQMKDVLLPLYRLLSERSEKLGVTPVVRLQELLGVANDLFSRIRVADVQQRSVSEKGQAAAPEWSRTLTRFIESLDITESNLRMLSAAKEEASRTLTGAHAAVQDSDGPDHLQRYQQELTASNARIEQLKLHLQNTIFAFFREWSYFVQQERSLLRMLTAFGAAGEMGDKLQLATDMMNKVKTQSAVLQRAQEFQALLSKLLQDTPLVETHLGHRELVISHHATATAKIVDALLAQGIDSNVIEQLRAAATSDLADDLTHNRAPLA